MKAEIRYRISHKETGTNIGAYHDNLSKALRARDAIYHRGFKVSKQYKIVKFHVVYEYLEDVEE